LSLVAADVSALGAFIDIRIILLKIIIALMSCQETKLNMLDKGV
jgi:hypothetical protein